ncbi:MAG TPA: signal recognition particle-docking protein FtsY [Phycisphaerae bacterium]|nr:signal recognition particle-docking protein FtsY [Phycisphaerae bacterium]
MGLFDRFKKGLAKTREKISRSFHSILPFGRKIDEALLAELEETMLADDMGPAATARLIDEVRTAYKAGEISETQEIIPFLQSKVIAYWPEADRQLRLAPSGPTVIVVAGVNGSGKTTSVAKLCNYLSKQSKKVILAACDTYRAAAVAQLTVWSERLGVQIVKHDQGADPGAVAYDACEAALARQADFLIIDTAGRLHTQDNLMRELGKIQRVIQKKFPDGPHEVLLILDSTIGQNAINQAKIFGQHVNVTGLFLAKLDGSAKGGIVIGIRDQLNIPVKFVGLGEAPDDIEPFDPAEFVKALFSEPEQ